MVSLIPFIPHIYRWLQGMTHASLKGLVLKDTNASLLPSETIIQIHSHHGIEYRLDYYTYQ